MKILGIDLGTTNSCVYYLDDNGNAVLVTDKKLRKFFPSVVWKGKKDNEVIVGHEAKVRMGQNPAPIVAVKRLMGTNRTVLLGGQQVTPVEVSAHILSHTRKLVEDHFAEQKIDDQIGGVVVTIPAYFDAAPRQDTHQAAVQAFFGGDRSQADGRLELLLEPEAAAYAYLVENPADKLRILVYDLGGGTFDVTILDKSPEAGLTMLRFGGDPHLGGDNIDDRIATWISYLLRGGRAEVLDRILDSKRYEPEKQYTILQQVLTNDLENLGGDLHAQDRDLLISHRPLYALDIDPNDAEDQARAQKLKSLAEKAKKDLTENTEALIAKQGAFEDREGTTVDIDFTLSRMDFNRLTGDFIKTTLHETFGVVERAGLTRSQIDRVLLVGGSTRMPCVREELQKAFDCPIEMVDPDLIVARGAAIRGRDLKPPAPPEEADERITVEYPRQTSSESVTISGRFPEPLSGYEVYVLRDGEDIAHAQIEGDCFEVRDVPLVRNVANRLSLEVTDQNENSYAAKEIIIVHPCADEPTTFLTKPIRYLGTRGFVTLFEEGAKLPAEKTHTCSRATQDDFIFVPLFEGERPFDQIDMPGIDPSLPIGAMIDLHVVIKKDYQGSATATVRSTGQSQSVHFEISHVEIPSMEDMDRDLADALEQIENDIPSVRDPNRRAEFNGRRRKLEAAYRKARRALTPDVYHLFTIIGELRKLQIEIASAQVFLEPPFEVFERFFSRARQAASQIKESHAMRKGDALEKIAALERVIKDIWERANRDTVEEEDVRSWSAIAEELADFVRDIETMTDDSGSGPRGREYPPEDLQRMLLEAVREMRNRATENGLDAQFDQEIRKVENALRQVDMRDRGEARNTLAQILEEQLKPLDFKIESTLKGAGKVRPKGPNITTVS